MVIEESADGAFGSDESVASVLDLGQPPAGVLSMPEHSPGEPLSIPNAGDISATKSGDVGPSSPGTFGSSFADLAPKHLGSTGPEPDGTNDTVGVMTKLPEVGKTAPNVVPRPAESYASTPTQFNLPDPADAQSKFDPSRGLPFKEVQPAGFKMTDQSPEMAINAVGGGNTESAKENRGLTNAISLADAMFAKGQLKEALATLSVFYGMPDLSDAQRGQLLSRLDPLAREVIYSRRHLLEQPHRVTASETLVKIAEKNEVPWQLLANINNVDDPMTVLPGTELKMIRGPFRAEVDLTAKQLTLFLGDLYAGRFAIEVGNDPPPSPGTFTIQEKQTEHVYYNRSGVPVPAGSPGNPYGGMWLDLGGQICIHGSPNTVQPTTEGCISVAGDHADDVYGILSQGSSVTIRR
ncbi:MAG: L,D-transpeptidase family protein [Planctomycetales bacterium]|nr:L,D-transpeptidase family protein [Planctomycetales bacterium]